MKKIKLKVTDFWTGFENEYLFQLITEHFPIELSDSPDYLFYSVCGYDHINYPNTVKIFFTGENVVPDFNLCDYAMDFQYITYEDRYLRFPLYYIYRDDYVLAEKKHIFSDSKAFLERDFCSFVVSNARPLSEREKVFLELSKYKKVNSGGSYHNNIGGKLGGSGSDKREFQHKHKFSICAENSISNGYVTEKLLQGFSAQTVPIYWGSPRVSDDFNPKAFINISDFKNLDEAIEYIKAVDNDDNLYLEMLRQPAFSDTNIPFNAMEAQVLKFLENIFSQPKEDAIRRKNQFLSRSYVENHLRNAAICRKYGRVSRLMNTVSSLDIDSEFEKFNHNDIFYKTIARILMEKKHW